MIGILKARVSVTNIVEFNILLIHEVLDFFLFDVINLISDPLCPGLRLEDTGVVYDNMMQNFFWGKNVCAGGIKDKKVVQLGINIGYMVVIFLWAKS